MMTGAAVEAGAKKLTCDEMIQRERRSNIEPELVKKRTLCSQMKLSMLGNLHRVMGTGDKILRKVGKVPDGRVGTKQTWICAWGAELDGRGARSSCLCVYGAILECRENLVGRLAYIEDVEVTKVATTLFT